MALKDRFFSAVTTHRTKNNSNSSSSSSSRSSKSSSSKTSTTSSASSLSSTSTLFGTLRRSNATATEPIEEWVDPPLKYSDPPQQEFVDLLASWDWEGATRHRKGGMEDCVSPGTSRRGSWA